jgi:hypothetical protein
MKQAFFTTGTCTVFKFLSPVFALNRLTRIHHYFYPERNTESNETVWELPAGLQKPTEAGPIKFL